MKKIFPLRWIYFVFLGVVLAATGVGLSIAIYLSFHVKEDTLCYLGIVCGAFIAIGSGIYAVRIIAYTKIELQEDQIFVHKGVGSKGENLIQHEKRVKFSEISHISYYFGINDSEGGSLKTLFRPIFFLVFFDKREKPHAISMDFYTKRQTELLIDLVTARCKEAGNELPVASGEEFIANAIAEIKEHLKRKKK